MAYQALEEKVRRIIELNKNSSIEVRVDGEYIGVSYNINDARSKYYRITSEEADLVIMDLQMDGTFRKQGKGYKFRTIEE